MISTPIRLDFLKAFFFLDGEKVEGGLQFDSSLHISRRTNPILIQVGNWSTAFLRLGNSLATVFIFHGYTNHTSSHPELFLGKAVLKMCKKFTGEHPCRSMISIKLLCNFIEITLRHWCSPGRLLHIFRTIFPKNTSVHGASYDPLNFLYKMYKLSLLKSLTCLSNNWWSENIN